MNKTRPNNAIEKLPLALHAATSSTNAILQVAHHTVTQIATVSAVHYFSNVFHERKTFMMLFWWRRLPSNSRLALSCQVVLHCVEFLLFHWHLRQQLQREQTQWVTVNRATTCHMASIHMHTPTIRTLVTIAMAAAAVLGIILTLTTQHHTRSGSCGHPS